MSSFKAIRKDHKLSTPTKIHIHQALLQSIVLYASKTRTMLASDVSCLSALHMRCHPDHVVPICKEWSSHINHQTTINLRTHISQSQYRIWTGSQAIGGRSSQPGPPLPCQLHTWHLLEAVTIALASGGLPGSIQTTTFLLQICGGSLSGMVIDHLLALRSLQAGRWRRQH